MCLEMIVLSFDPTDMFSKYKTVETGVEKKNGIISIKTAKNL